MAGKSPTAIVRNDGGGSGARDRCRGGFSYPQSFCRSMAKALPSGAAVAMQDMTAKEGVWGGCEQSSGRCPAEESWSESECKRQSRNPMR